MVTEGAEARGDPFAALGDPHRRRILALLADEPQSVGALAGELPISRPAVSRHLRLLKEAGLVVEEAHGTRHLYRLHDQGLEAVQQYLAGVWGEAAERFRLVAENTNPKRKGRPVVIEPLRVEVDLACPAEHAFATWTERFALWWPPAHTVSGDPAAIVLEPRLGGRIYERTHDGREIDWGEITAWDPPTRLAYLWHIRRDRREATDVEVRFVAAGDHATRIEITHTGWERLGDQARAWRDANRGGWNGLLPHFAAACIAVETKEQ